MVFYSEASAKSNWFAASIGTASEPRANVAASSMLAGAAGEPCTKVAAASIGTAGGLSGSGAADSIAARGEWGAAKGAADLPTWAALPAYADRTSRAAGLVTADA